MCLNIVVMPAGACAALGKHGIYVGEGWGGGVVSTEDQCDEK